MKNLLFILATLIPMALNGQAETTITSQSDKITTLVPTKKNAFTASTYIGANSGLALDYRRNINKNREFIVGVQSTYNGLGGLNIGFRKYYKTDKKLSFGIGADAGLKQRNIIGDNLVTRAIESTLLKVDYGEFKFIGGAYYKINDKLDFMAEMQLRPFIPFLRNSNSSRNIKVGLKYNF